MEMIRQALSGFLTGIILLGLIVLIFRKKENESNKNNKK